MKKCKIKKVFNHLLQDLKILQEIPIKRITENLKKNKNNIRKILKIKTINIQLPYKMHLIKLMI